MHPTRPRRAIRWAGPEVGTNAKKDQPHALTKSQGRLEPRHTRVAQDGGGLQKMAAMKTALSHGFGRSLGVADDAASTQAEVRPRFDRPFSVSAKKLISFPSPHSRGALPLAEYDRTHRLKHGTRWWQRGQAAVFDVIEAMLVRSGIHGDQPVFENAQFPWAAEVERSWPQVREELDHVMHYRDQMPSFQDIVKEVGTIQTDDKWKTFFFKGLGMDCEENARRCPATMRLLDKIPNATTAFFSILSPDKHIPAHRGAWAGVLRLHLGLLVPEPRDKARIRIANRICHWEEGKCLIFDDTWNHEVWNDTDGHRVVLFVDFERPLREPWQWINHFVMNVVALAPFLREAKTRERTWEKRMWGLR